MRDAVSLSFRRQRHITDNSPSAALIPTPIAVFLLLVGLICANTWRERYTGAEQRTKGAESVTDGAQPTERDPAAFMRHQRAL